jgi:hypothetical protein
VTVTACVTRTGQLVHSARDANVSMLHPPDDHHTANATQAVWQQLAAAVASVWLSAEGAFDREGVRSLPSDTAISRPRPRDDCQLGNRTRRGPRDLVAQVTVVRQYLGLPVVARVTGPRMARRGCHIGNTSVVVQANGEIWPLWLRGRRACDAVARSWECPSCALTQDLVEPPLGR